MNPLVCQVERPRDLSAQIGLTGREDIPNLFWSMLAEMADEAGVAPPPWNTRVAEVLQEQFSGDRRDLKGMARLYLLARDTAAGESEMARRLHIVPSQWAPGDLKKQVKLASKQAEGEIIRRTLEQNRWNRRLTASALRISYRSLMYKMKSCNIRGGGARNQSSTAQ